MALAYHEIPADGSAYLYGVSRRVFDEHMEAVSCVEKAAAAGESLSLVTFDDGHRSNYEYALPILNRLHLRATFFVTAGWTDTQPEYMNRAQLRELASCGHRIQAHGWSHKMLTLCSPAELYDELRFAKQALEDLLGSPVDAISIPHGRWNARVLDSCRAAGYRDVYTSDAHSTTTRRNGIRLIGRLMVTRHMTKQRIAQYVNQPLAKSHRGLVKDIVKEGARYVLGEKRYHQFWRSLASQAQSPVGAPIPTRPKRVLHLISSGGFYGAEAMILNLSLGLREAGCDSMVGVFRNARNPHVEVAERAIASGIPAEVIPCRKRIDTDSLRQIRQLVYDHGIDVVHTHGFKSDVYGALAVRRLGVSLVATHHSNWPARGVRLLAYHLLDRLTLKSFGGIVAVSEEIRNSLESSGVPSRKLRVIQNGIDVKPFEQAARRQNEQKIAGMDVGLIGRLITGKGHLITVEAAAAIRERYPSARFLFFGEGPERANIAKRIAELNLEQTVILAGQRSDMPEVFASLDAVILPSATEGLPMTLIEALAAGKAVAASNVGGIPGLVRHRETGLLVRPGDIAELTAAILELLSDEHLRESLGLQGQRWVVQNFSALKMAGSYSQAYDDISPSLDRIPGKRGAEIRLDSSHSGC